MGKEKVEENVIFYCLVEVKREEERKYGAWNFLGLTIFFSPNEEESRRENDNQKK